MASLVMFLGPVAWVSVVFFVITMKESDKWSKKKDLSFWENFFLNLLILLFLTTAIDLIRMTFFQSWVIFFGGGYPHF